MAQPTLRTVVHTGIQALTRRFPLPTRWHKLLAIFFGISILFDTTTTALFMTHPRLTEMNPLMHWAWTVAGPLGIILMKLAILSAAYPLVYVPTLTRARFTLMLTTIVGTVNFLAGTNNLIRYLLVT